MSWIYEFDPAKFLSTPELAYQAALKKSKVRSYFLTDINMLLKIEKLIWGGICHSIYQYAKANNKYMKDYDKNKESSCIQYWDVNNLYGRNISQKLPVNNFKWIKDSSQFNEDFTKIIMKKVVKDVFLNLMFNILKIYIIFIMIDHFYLKELRLKKSKSL